MKNDLDRVVPLAMESGDALPDVLTSDYLINPHFQMHDNEYTHAMMDNVAQQFIQSNGMVGYFLPKDFEEIDHVMGEEMGVKYDKMWRFAFYLEDYTGFSGSSGSAFDYGGFSSHDRMKIMINPKLFQNQCHGRMPDIGDWVYIPKDKSLFSVRQVDPYNKFYQFGYNAQYFLILTKTVYNQESIDPVLQNLEFGLGYDNDEDEIDLSPLINLDGRLDTHINEFVTAKGIQNEAKSLVVTESSHQGEGVKFGADRVEIITVDEINKLLSGRR